jgi:hypothetical protein
MLIRRAKKAADKANGVLAKGGKGKQTGKAGGKEGEGGGEGGDADSDGDGEGGPGPGGGAKKDQRRAARGAEEGVSFKDKKVTVPVNEGSLGDITGDAGTVEPGEAESNVPFEKVLVKYRAEMEKAMEQETYPEEYRRAVKEYFDSLSK